MEPTELNPVEVTIAYLEHRSEQWADLKHRCERTHWLDAALVHQYEQVTRQVDTLLEEYAAHLSLRDTLEQL